MNQWNCCRTCLSTTSLNPIFDIPNKSNKYTEILLITTGLKIELNDNLPQFICTQCINNINVHMDFRSLCQKTYKTLNQMNKQPFQNNVSITEKDKSVYFYGIEKDKFDDVEAIFNNCNEDMPADCTSLPNDTNGLVKKEQHIEFEISVKDVLKRRLDIIINNLKPYKKVELTYAEVENQKKRFIKKKEDKVAVECKICHKICKDLISLSSHYKIHMELKVICEHCGKKFSTKRKLLMHCKSKHGYEKTDKCSFCDYRGSNPELVKIHERLHTGERPYVCSECGATFHRKSSYLQHVAIHLPEKTVQCQKCPALFKSVTLMRIHASRHKRRR